MERWNGRVALVTGSSAGIGAAICEVLVKQGMKVVGAARRIERVEDLAKKLKGENGVLIPAKCDITKDDEVYAMFDSIKKNQGGVDICINNAAMSFNNSLLDGTPEEWRYMFNLNVIAVCLCTKLAVASMKERGVDDGHIININSVGGHTVVPFAASHFYCGTKFALRAITEGVRQELRAEKSHIRVSAISPGVVKTEIASVMYNSEEAAEKLYESNPYISAEELAATVLHVISSPPHVEINDVIVTPLTQNYDFDPVK